MQKKINVLSIVLLIVYGTLTLVAVPLHHHSAEYTASPQIQSLSPFHTIDCDVCTFSSTQRIDFPIAYSTKFLQPIAGFHFAQDESATIVNAVETHPRRGPPSFLL